MAKKNVTEEVVEETVVEETVEKPVEETAVEVVEESKLKTTLANVGAGIKKHGKKIAVAVGVAAVGLIGVALAKKSGGDDYDYDAIDLNSDSWNITDLDETSNDSNVEEAE